MISVVLPAPIKFAKELTGAMKEMLCSSTRERFRGKVIQLKGLETKYSRWIFLVHKYTKKKQNLTFVTTDVDNRLRDVV